MEHSCLLLADAKKVGLQCLQCKLNSCPNTTFHCNRLHKLILFKSIALLIVHRMECFLPRINARCKATYLLQCPFFLLRVSFYRFAIALEAAWCATVSMSLPLSRPFFDHLLLSFIGDIDVRSSFGVCICSLQLRIFSLSHEVTIWPAFDNVVLVVNKSLPLNSIRISSDPLQLNQPHFTSR